MKQKIKLLLKSQSVFAGGLLLASLFFLSEVCLAKGIVIPNFEPPKKEDVIWMESISVENLKINFLKETTPGRIAGRVVSENELSNIKKINYSIKSVTGSVFFEISEDEVDFDEAGAIKFDFSLEDIRLTKNSVLVVEVFNKKGNLMASGEQKVASQLFFADPEISNLEIEIKKEVGVASFDLVNQRDDIVAVWPRVEIYNLDETELVGKASGSFIGIGTEGKQSLSVEFQLPEDPQVYVLKALAESKDGVRLGGVLEKRFLIKGVFAHVKSFELLEEGLMAKKANFVFTGVTKPDLKLDVKINAVQEWEGTIVDKYQKIISVKSDKRGRFTGSVSFKLEEDSDYFMADVFVMRKDTIIGKEHLEKKIIVAPNLAAEIAKQREALEREEAMNKAKWWLSKDFLVWGVILIALILFATNNWLRLHKKNLWIFLLFTLSWQTALGYGDAELGDSPQVWWRHPVESWYYNPNPDDTDIPTVGFEHFSKLRMNGEILDALLTDVDPNALFASPVPDTKPTAILINFTKGGGAYDDWFGVATGDNSGDQDFDLEKMPTPQYDFSSVSRSVEFELEVDIQNPINPDDAYKTLIEDSPRVTLQEFLDREDGDWAYTVYFCMYGQLDDITCSDQGGSYPNSQWYAATPRILKIDSTDPTIDFAPQELHADRIAADKVTLETRIISRDGKRITRRQKVIELQGENLLYGTKDGERIETVRQRDDVVTRIGIVEARMIKLNQDLNDPFIPVEKETELLILLYGIDKTPVGSGGDGVGGLEQLLGSLEDQRDVDLNPAIIALDIEVATLTNTTIPGTEGEISTIDTDVLVLEAEIATLKASIKAIKDLSETAPVGLAIGCTDPGGVGFSDISYEVQVRGNFCDDATICDATGTRVFKVCDEVGNCVEGNENKIDWYDPVSPEISITLRKDNDGNGELDSDFTEGVIKSGNVIAFELSGATTDSRKKTNMPNPEDNSSVGPTLEYDYNENACGGNVNAPFYEDTVNSVCVETLSICANSATDRGDQELNNGGACNSFCEFGDGLTYIYNDGICLLDCDRRNLSICLPGILGRGENCSPGYPDYDNWFPDPATKQLGVPFVQENNCGDKRQAVGTATDVCSFISKFGCAPFTGAASFQP